MNNVRDCFDRLLTDPRVQQGLEQIKQDEERRIAEQIAITEIPASPFQEAERAADLKRRFTDLGLDTQIDEVGNVIGHKRGSAAKPTLVVSAHLDTVFPEGYDATVRIEDGILHAPGISDDGAGLAALLSLVRVFRDLDLPHVGDLLFVGTVGEEGRGDLRGAKHLFQTRQEIDGFISIDGEELEEIIYLALGSKRFEVAFRGPGGHSFSAFDDVPNPVHAMGRAINRIADLEVPEDPKTTFSVSVVSGGTSVNAIPDEAVMQTDTRSVCPEQLDRTVSALVNCAKAAVIEENAHKKIPWDNPNNLEVEITLIGDRPSGSCAKDALHVQVARAATEAVGATPSLKPPASTDASIPINLGIPALTLGVGGIATGVHSLKESFDPKDAYLAVQRAFVAVLAFVGIGKIEPLLTAGPTTPET